MIDNLKTLLVRPWLRVIERFPFLAPNELGDLQCFFLASMLMATALWARLALAPIQAGLQYLTFFPAVALAAIVGGYRAGLFAVVIGVVFATCIFTYPYYSFSIESIQASLLSNMVFLVDGFIVSLSIEAMHRYRQQYADELTVVKESEEWLRISSVAFEMQESIIITDSAGVILQVNKAFAETTGYSSKEIIGQTPRLFRSGRHDAAFYRAMWDSINRTGSWQGEIWDRRKNGEVYPKWLNIRAIKDTNGTVTHYVGVHTDISERKTAEEEIKYLAFYDSLTQLPNRRLLLDRLHQALSFSESSGLGGALMVIDLDNFKTINDTLGHTIGDILLKQVAQRLSFCVRECDTVARIGGDEFVVMLEGLGKETQEITSHAATMGERILATLNQPYHFDAYELQNTLSIGISLFNEDHQGFENLFKQADIAMYQAKKDGRNTLRFFDSGMQENINTHATLERELGKAIENEQFELHYQIQVDSSGRAFGAEALIRWIHPERGSVSPAHFIPIAEESGIILSIGQWVLEAACSQLNVWKQSERTNDLVLSINISAKQFHDDNFVTKVQKAIERHDIDPNLLKLEITESMLLEGIEDIIASMRTLSAMGVQISLDDFGTGYSSLQYLKRLPLCQLKIDQSFVRDLDTDSSDKAIVTTIIAMAMSLNLDVIAEGVETEEQRMFLLNNGCAHFQGHLFGKPVPIEQFEELLQQN